MAIQLPCLMYGQCTYLLDYYEINYNITFVNIDPRVTTLILDFLKIMTNDGMEADYSDFDQRVAYSDTLYPLTSVPKLLRSFCSHFQ
uniref:Uncharacterized protein n=1 Tax=viral metagenome TaxID=1070528 RepID=A0A6C0JAS6_9ZZZZ